MADDTINIKVVAQQAISELDKLHGAMTHFAEITDSSVKQTEKLNLAADKTTVTWNNMARGFARSVSHFKKLVKQLM